VVTPTARQKQILEFVTMTIGNTGIAPSIHEIKDHFSLGSTATVHKHLKNLEYRGLLSRSPNLARGISAVQTVRLAESANEGDEVDIMTGKVVKALTPKPERGTMEGTE
jgi:SOS-response transcriptional repressor LexA